MRLKYQLFMALLLASALLILLMYVISSWSFSRGLLEYVNQNSAQQAQSFARELESIHEERQSWEWAKDPSPEWHSLVRSEGAARSRPPRRENRKPPYVLADASRVVIAGPRERGSREKLITRMLPDIQWLEINGQSGVVGFLGYRQVRVLDTELDRAFEVQQKKSFALAGIGLIILSALLAAPMSSIVLKPLLRIGNVVDRIRHGEYQHRVSTRRRDELGALAKDINLLAKSLESNRDARQRWIAEISHELRTPLSVMRAELEAMQDGIRPVTEITIESLHAELMGLNRLVDDLHTLSLSDVGALDYKFETVSLHTVLTEFLDSAKSGLVDATLALTTDLNPGPYQVKADTQRIQQLLSNLYQNSLRYTDTGGTLAVRLQPADNSMLQIIWSDSSPGVSDDALMKLFDPLFRGEKSRNRASGGAGLGLSIVERIVQAHNGTIRAQHSASGGVEIDIRLPITTADG